MSPNVRTWFIGTLVAMICAGTSGCASISEGFARALAAPEPVRRCDIAGPAFDGLEGQVQTPQGTSASTKAERLKIILVHGIGTHEPGWSLELQRNLSAALGINVVREHVKEFDLTSDFYPGEHLGHLAARLYTNEAGTRGAVMYELTWSGITAKEKQAIAYDTSTQYQSVRADVNAAMKSFLNDRISDPMMYRGETRARILEAATRATCWAMLSGWEGLPDHPEGSCRLMDVKNFQEFREGRLVFVTHSLGSRIVTDMLQQAAANIEESYREAQGTDEGAEAKRVVDALRQMQITVYMLANQLPLLQLGQPAPEVVNQIHGYCVPGSAHYNERTISKLFIVAFSDPNDVLSYAIPSGYAAEHMDSRLCPTIANVLVNVTDVVDLIGIGKLANPMKAHVNYEADPRVIGLIAEGIGSGHTSGVVAKECHWTRVIPN